MNQAYLERGRAAKWACFDRGVAWLDTGTFASLNEASTFVRVIEERQSTKIGCIEEVAHRQGFIDREQLSALAARYGGNPYGVYLQRVVDAQVS